MSRIGKQPIHVPSGVTLSFAHGTVTVKGIHGSLDFVIPSGITVTQKKENEFTVAVQDEKDEFQRAMWGTTQRHIRNMCVGVSECFEKRLELVGVGFKVKMQGNDIVLNVGYSHSVVFPIPNGVLVRVEGNLITVQGADKQLVGEVASRIRKVKKNEPYKGKGIKYQNEVVRRKAGKQASSSSV